MTVLKFKQAYEETKQAQNVWKRHIELLQEQLNKAYAQLNLINKERDDMEQMIADYPDLIYNTEGE